MSRDVIRLNFKLCVVIDRVDDLFVENGNAVGTGKTHRVGGRALRAGLWIFDRFHGFDGNGIGVFFKVRRHTGHGCALKKDKKRDGKTKCPECFHG